MIVADKLSTLHRQELFDEQGEEVSMQQVEESILVYTHPQDLYNDLQPFFELGADRISLHNIHRNHDFFIENFGGFLKAQK